MLRRDLDVEQFNQRGAQCLPGLVGFELLSIDEQCLRARMKVRPELMAPNGFLHAASVIALADTACGYGVIAHLPEGAAGFTTIELKANFLGTTREGIIACEATPVHLGRTTHVWDAVVAEEATSKRIALFRCTQMILTKR
jgi:uncharacterized protein (TIGR00369 family)